MSATPSDQERRQHRRYPLAAGMQFHHGPSRREIHARSMDISAGGMRMCVPATAPVSSGQPLRVYMGGTRCPELVGMGDKPISATIVRVDRSGLITTGQLTIGVRFTAA